MDIEADIRALQLDSAEENNGVGVVIPTYQNSDGVEIVDKMDEDLKDEVQESVPTPDVQQAPEDHDQEILHPVHNPAKAKEKAAQEKAAKEEAEEEAEANKKRHLNVVFIGHVDAGKSTIGGQILFLSGQVDDRQIQKYEKEAKEKSRESWYMAYIMDTNEEERAKGKTVEVGRAHFETETTRFTILDAPGHKSYVPNMISGASQADIGVLVISARKGEFETGYERGGQTREHVQLAKTLGVSKLVVVVNKMDDPTVNWSKERYDEIEQKMVPFLKSSGYNTKKDVIFLPISGLMGTNIDKSMDRNVCPWFSGPSFFEVLNAIEVPPRDPNGPFRMPIIDKFKDMGTVVMGKVESGSIREGDSLIVMPNKEHAKVVAIYCDEDKVKRAGPGENLRVRITGIEDEDILAGFVLSSTVKPVPAVTEFVAQLQILELLDNAIFTAGYKAILHIHAVVEECEIIELISQIDMKTRKPMKKKILFVKNGAAVVCRIQVSNSICVEKFSDFPQLGRFTLRTEGKTIAGKSSLLEALLGFRFNVREVEMGTRRPLILQMVHDVSALEPRCRFQDEDSEEYGSPIVSATAVADVIRSRTEALLRKTKTAVSPKPIVMRAEYAHSPNLTIIDTPGFVLKAKKGEPETTPDEILSMVKSLASPPHRILLFLQQSSVEWCSSLWLDAVREIDSSFRRTIVVVSKFDNRLKEFNDRGEVDRYLSASGYLGENTRPYFVALPKDRSTVSNDEFRRQISQVDMDVIRHLREGVKGGFDEEKFRSHIGFGSLRDFLESELQKRYKDAAPATLALLEQRCSEVTDDMLRMDMKIQATSDVAHLRKAAMLYMASISNHVGALIDGAANPAPEQWGKTTEEERGESGIGSWPGVCLDIKPPNAVLRLYGGAAFERVIHEFRCAAYSIECPPVSREKVANILLAHAGRGGGRGVTEASAEIARTAARSWLAPLLDTACDRLAFVLGSLFEIALERNLNQNSEYEKKAENMDGYVGFHAALRNCYSRFVKNLAKQCKQLVRHHLDSVTSPYSMACYESDYHQGGAFGSYYKPNQASGIGSFCFELSDTGRDEPKKDQENIPPEKSKAQETTPGKGEETHITVPETPSPDQPCEIGYDLVKKEIGNGHHHDGGGARKRVARMGGNRNIQPLRIQNGGGGLLFGTTENGMKSSSAYTEICSSAAQHFARIREVLVERSVTSTLNSGFLTPCRDRLVVALGVDLFAVNDEKFMDMFVAPGAIDMLQNERQQLQKRQKILHSCLTEFKTVSRSL